MSISMARIQPILLEMNCSCNSIMNKLLLKTQGIVLQHICSSGETCAKVEILGFVRREIIVPAWLQDNFL